MMPDEAQRTLHEQIRSQLSCAPGPRDEVRVLTPLMYPDRDTIDVFVFARDGQLVATDHGDAIGWLFTRCGVSYSELSARQRGLLDDICRSLGVAFEQGELTVRCAETARLAQSVMLVAQAIARVADLSYTLEASDGTEDAMALPSNGAQRHALGAVSGLVTSLKKIDELEFTVQDTAFRSAVTCHLREGQEDEARRAWDTCVTVTGMVERDPDTGRPTHVRQISRIEPLPEHLGGAWRNARGTLSWAPGDPPAEAAIRRIRDDP